MGQINILNDAGTNKLSLEFNGTSDGTLNTSGLINHDLINVTSAGNTVINGVSTTHTKMMFKFKLVADNYQREIHHFQ